MATPKLDTYEVVDDVRQCRDAVRVLLKQPLIAVDAEGVNLGRTGPMTLIQVAMESGHVYLFDVYRHGRPMPEMFSEGKLRDLFESEKVLKVMHAGSNDGTALKFQYDVTLKNVYDVQVAQQALDEAEGRQLPRRRKLMEVCKIYLPDTSDLDDKDDIQAKWHLSDAEFWARRPFTQEMIDYACADVRQLIPEVYNRQKKLLQEKGLEAEVSRRVQEDLQSRWDDQVKEAVIARERQKIFDVIRQVERRHPRGVDLARLQDEDELTAVSRVREDELDNFFPTIRSLKLQYYRKEIGEIKESLQDEGASFFSKKRDYFFLFRLKNHEDEAIQKESKQLLQRIEKLEVEHMSSKYRKDTPLKHVSEQDKKTLRFLRPGKEQYTVVVTRLHWLLKEEDLEQTMQRLRDDREAFRQSYNPGQEKYLRFLTSNSPTVPASLKPKARELLRMLQDAGLVQPQSASRRQHSRR